MRPDLPAVDKAFDYLVPASMADDVVVGAIVRIPLHGRRVRGWVVADDVVPETDHARLRPLLKVSSAGPPPEILDLCAWVAWRYAGRQVGLLRTASPPNTVLPTRPGVADARTAPAGTANGVDPARELCREVLVWPPATDRRPLVLDRLAASGSTIVIVPDAARAPVLMRELVARGHAVLSLRADQTDAQRSAAWDRARRGGCVVIGSRLAVFAPVPDLEAIIVLDEGDESLQDERAPTWNAREVALERARRTGAALTLASPAPSLEAEMDVGLPIRPNRAVEREGWPTLIVVDQRDEPPGRGMFSDGLVAALHKALTDNGRALCVLNRKGRARLMVCAACGTTATCEFCGAAVMETATGLACQRCAAERPMVCRTCHAVRFKALRRGITRVRDELDALLARAQVAEVDASTEDVPVADVLVGTEAVLHRVPRVPERPVRLVAYLDVDQELLAPRYRAAEQALWLLIRGARLVGPRSGGGCLLVQTRVPDHEVLESVRSADPGPVTEAERGRRRLLGYPPYGALAEISGAPDAVTAAASSLRSAGLTVLGPTLEGLSARALVHGPTVSLLCDQLAVTLEAGSPAGRLRVAVDPPRI